MSPSHSTKENAGGKLLIYLTSLSNRSISSVTVIANTRCELVGLGRFDFIKVSTDRTLCIMKDNSDARIGISDIAEGYRSKFQWDKYKEKVMKQVLKDRKRHGQKGSRQFKM
jgi:hypothetical protein